MNTAIKRAWCNGQENQFDRQPAEGFSIEFDAEILEKWLRFWLFGKLLAAKTSCFIFL